MDRVDAALAAIKAAGVAVTLDSAKVLVPGAWLTLDTIRRRNVAGEHVYECSLYLITGDSDTKRVATSLLNQLDQLLVGGITPDGAVTASRVLLDSNPTPLPALRVPLNI